MDELNNGVDRSPLTPEEEAGLAALRANRDLGALGMEVVNGKNAAAAKATRLIQDILDQKSTL